MKKILSLVMILAFSANSWAITIGAAKAQGLVGERSDGYVGYVVTPARADVKTLVKGVNNKRKERFKRAVAKTNATMEQVSASFAQSALSKTKPGHYIQNANGQWVKK